MATYHCSIKHGSKGSGASSLAKSDYICREGKYADKPDREYKESGSMPEWAQASPRAFWHAGDHYERANGRVYTEIEVALPREISPDQRRELVQTFIREQLPGQPYTVAIHNPKATLDGGDQPHAHIIFSERKLDGIERSREQFFKRANAKEPEKGGTAKDRTWNEREKVQQIRETWEQYYNRYSPEQVSCRSLKEQGLDREPERHLGPKMARPDSTEAGKVLESRETVKKLEEITREMATLSQEIATQDIVVGEKPQKTRPAPTAERKSTKKQDSSHTPEPTRSADPDEPASSSRNTTSRERETARLDQVQARKAIEAFQTALRNRGDSEKVIAMATARAVERFHLKETEPEGRTMTGPEIKAVLFDEGDRLRKLENAARSELNTIPETREAIVTGLAHRLVPEWREHDEKTSELVKSDKQCRELETAWLQAQKNNGWKYLPPLPPEAGAIEQFKRKAVYTLMGEKQFAWQREGASLKEWRPRIDAARANLEQKTQELQTRTNGFAPQINGEANKLMTRRAELRAQLDQAYGRQVQIREVCDKCPKGDKVFDVRGRDASSLMADKNLHKQMKKEKDLEKALDRGQGIGR